MKKKTPTVSDVDSLLRSYVTAYVREHAPGKQPGEMTREELEQVLAEASALPLTDAVKNGMIKGMLASGELHRRRQANHRFYSLVKK